jgi:hypothetical protein
MDELSLDIHMHILKTDPKPFEDVWQYKKTFEVRKNDRNFKVGDELILKETYYTGEEMKKGKPLTYTQREIGAKVLHVLHGPVYGLQEGWCIMSIRLMYCK